MNRQQYARNWLMLAALVVFWGSSFAMTRIAVADLSPLWVMALRLCIGALVLYAMMRREGLVLPTGKNDLLWFVWLGAIGSVLPFFLISWGAQYLPSGLVGILMAVVPLVTLTLAHFLLPDEPLSGARMAGFVLGFCGLVVLLGPQFLLGLDVHGKTVLALAAILLAASAYAMQLVTARLSPVMAPLQKSAGVVLAASVGGLILALAFDPSGLGAATPTSLLATVTLGIFPTALAALLLFRLIDTAGASFVSLSNYLISPFAYFVGILTMGEVFEMRALLGLFIILAGIYVAERR